MFRGLSTAWLPFLPMVCPRPDRRLPDRPPGNGERAGRPWPCLPLPLSLQGEGEAYHLSQDNGVISVSGGEAGVLYGVYEALCHLARGKAIQSGWRRPFYPLRMLNHWDNLDGRWNGVMPGARCFFDDRAGSVMTRCASTAAPGCLPAWVSTGFLNNTNVVHPADKLPGEAMLPELAELTDIPAPVLAFV